MLLGSRSLEEARGVASRTEGSAAATRPTVVWMNLSDAPAALVVVQSGPWRFRFLVDTDPSSGLLRDLAETAHWISSRAAA
jgi:hypothetical protein